MVIGESKIKGYSLIELVVSTLLASIVISNVYFFWKYINKHIAYYSSEALLHKESDRIIHVITSSVRKASEIIYYNSNSIIFTTEENKDTISYTFSNDSLFRNKKPVTILMKRASVKSFEIQNLNQQDDLQHKSPHLFLEFKLILKNQRGTESEVKLAVKTKQPLQDSDPTLGW